ncbi:hypothetical protein D3C87_324120 [compost metagenome]
MIIAAAIKIADVVCFIPNPARHHNVLHSLMESFTSRTDKGYMQETQGFLTDTGVFLDRTEAMKHALECGQGTPRRDRILATGYRAYNGDGLYSEDLW